MEDLSEGQNKACRSEARALIGPNSSVDPSDSHRDAMMERSKLKLRNLRLKMAVEANFYACSGFALALLAVTRHATYVGKARVAHEGLYQNAVVVVVST